MATYGVRTPTQQYPIVVQRGVLDGIGQYLPARHGRMFVVTNPTVWRLHGARLKVDAEPLFFPEGEEYKRLATVEALAEQMVRGGADRSSVVIAFGGGIAGDLGGFLAAIFMRGIPVLQVPTTLLAQVDAAIGGKTGANLVSGKNLVGAFHQPIAVLVDPALLTTLPEREYRAGLFEVLKYGIIGSPELFGMLEERQDEVWGQQPAIVDFLIGESIRIKAEVVSADERESGLRRILNFGHTIGHALEAETQYARLLHGEAVSFGMSAAVRLGQLAGTVDDATAARMLRLIERYGPIPALDGVTSGALLARLRHDKKALQGRIHFVLPEAIGRVTVTSGLDEAMIRQAIDSALEQPVRR